MADRIDEAYSLERWDATAKLWDRIVTDGGDYYRCEFFGPIHLDECGDVAGLRVLDVGCGSGYFSRGLAGRGADVVGIDWSGQMIEHAKAREADQPLGIEYRVMDARVMDEPFEPGTFDLITGCMSFMDIPDPTDALAAAAKLLKPGGRLVMCNTHPIQTCQRRDWDRDETGRKIGLKLGGYHGRRDFIAQWGEHRYGEPIRIVQHHFTLEDWSRMLEVAGMAIRRMREPMASDEVVARCQALDDTQLMPFVLIIEAVHAG